MMCLWSDSLMRGERSLGRGLCIDLCHPENAHGTFGGQCHEKTIYQLSWRRPQYSLFQSEVLSGIRNHLQTAACLSLGSLLSPKMQGLD